MKKKTAKKKVSASHKKPVFSRSANLIIYFIAAMLFVGVALLFLPDRTQMNIELCANSLSCIQNVSGNYDEENTGEFNGKAVTGPALAAAPLLAQNQQTNVLGDTTVDSKRIEVDLTNQRLYAYENEQKIYDLPISSGLPWYQTPTGDFRIWIKLRYTRMRGGSKQLGTYYDLPNVPYTMYFYNSQIPKYRGYGIHGAYWHNNFGVPMSHGCVNMREADVAQLYYWANPPSTANVNYATAENPGTLIRIYGKTPGT